VKEEISVYRVKTGADWLPNEVILDCIRPKIYAHQYPQLYRDDIEEGDDGWETDYFQRMDEVEGKPLELYIVATDELGAFAQAVAILNQDGDQD
jgi:hypothetical protein